MNQNKASQNLDYFWKKKAILSFIAVTLIVIIHNSATNQYSLPPGFFTQTTNTLHTFLAYIIGSVAVPLFFFLSGATLFRNYRQDLYFQKLKSRAKSILIPYLLWNIVGLLFAIIYTFTPLSSYISGRELFSPSLQNILEGIFLYKYNFQFWFLYDLIIYIILTPIIYLLVKNKTVGTITCIFALFLPLFAPSLLGVNSYFTIFYVVGCFVGKHFLPLLTKPSTKLLQIISLITTPILLTLKALSIYNLLSLPIVVSQILLLLLLFSVYYAADTFIIEIKTTPSFTKESFPLYITHSYFIAIIVKLIYLINPSSPVMLFLNEILSTIITICIVIFLSKLLKQKLPRVHAFLFGGR